MNVSKKIKSFLKEDIYENFVKVDDQSQDAYLVKLQILDYHTEYSLICQYFYIALLVLNILKELILTNFDILERLLPNIMISGITTFTYYKNQKNLQNIHRIHFLMIIIVSLTPTLNEYLEVYSIGLSLISGVIKLMLMNTKQ